MSVTLTYPYDAGASLGFSVGRLAAGVLSLYDPADGTFKAAPAAPVIPLVAGTGLYASIYFGTVASTPQAQWTDGDYLAFIHDMAAASAAVDALPFTMFGGSSATVFPAGAGLAPPSPAEIAAHLLDVEQAGALMLRDLFRALSAAMAGKLVPGPTGDTLYDAGSPATPRLVITYPGDGSQLVEVLP